MTVKRIFVQTCQLVVLLNLTHTYVLFAANLDDFKSIAKKFIPNKLAEQLTNLASHNSMQYRQQLKQPIPVDNNKDDDDYSDDTTEVAVTRFNVDKQVITPPKKRFVIKNQVHGVDFDELVDRVSEQLEVKFKNKLKDVADKKKSKKVYANEGVNTKEVNNKNLETAHEETSKFKVTRSVRTTEDTQYYPDDNSEPARQTYNKEITKNNKMLLEADLTKKKDSYEDYVMPSKDNIFDSDVELKTTKAKVKSGQQSRYKAHITSDVTVKQNLKPSKKKDIEDIPLFEDLDYEDEEHRSEEVKALTGSILDEPKDKDTKPKKLKGTMIPTREFYKISSPNYFAKLPVVAEKYDFNEPLPEMDREPENLKHFINPGVSVNKKVKLSRNV